MASYSKKNLVYVIFRNIVFILAIVAIWQYVYKNFETQLNDKKILRERFQNVYNDLEKFVKSDNADIAETKLKIEDVLSTVPQEYVSNQDLLTKYKDRVLDIAEEYSITIGTDTVIRDAATGMITMNSQFKTKYENLYKFLFFIEMFSQVKSFSVDKDNNVIVESNPILYSTPVNDYFSGRREQLDEVKAAGYFKEIIKKATDAVNSVGYIPSWRDIDPAPKNPFYEYIPPKAKAGVVSKPKKRKPPTIEITGIIYDANNPMVIIEGKIYKKGEFYKAQGSDAPPVKIIAIQERTITIELDGEKYIVKFNKEG